MSDVSRQQAKERLGMDLVVARVQAGLDVEAILSGRSMWPTLRPGVLVTIKACQKKCKIGDVVLIGPVNNGAVIHRLIHLDDDQVVTKGDGLPYCDKPWPKEKLLGKVTSVDGRNYQNFGHIMMGYALALISPLSRWPFSAFVRLRKLL